MTENSFVFLFFQKFRCLNHSGKTCILGNKSHVSTWDHTNPSWSATLLHRPRLGSHPFSERGCLPTRTRRFISFPPVWSPQNYSCPSVMVLAVPVAVRFLHRGNRELSRNMSSYLSLAAIAKADLLAEHTEAITLSVLGGRRCRNAPMNISPQLFTHIHLFCMFTAAKVRNPPATKWWSVICSTLADSSPL